MILALVALVALHELGHAACAAAHGLHPRLFVRWPWTFGIAARPTSWEQSRSVACAGPLASILAGLVLVAAGDAALGWTSILAFGVAQLAPLRRFDGHHILRRRHP